MKQKELQLRHLLLFQIEKPPLVYMVYLQIFQRFKG